MKRPRAKSSTAYHPQAFGGWGDYQTWADNQFLPKPQEKNEEPAPPPEPDPVPEPEPAPPPPTPAPARQEHRPEPLPDPDDFGDAEYSGRGYLDPPTLPEVPAPEWEDPRRAPKARPYVRTGGRTRADHDLRIETLLSSSEDSHRLAGDATQRALRDLCRNPVSVAEISARLGVPLGVSRVLISDAITAGVLLVHEPAVTQGSVPSLSLLHRVMEGLRNL